jgi:DNA-binding NarL/FixJ family response regulator
VTPTAALAALAAVRDADVTALLPQVQARVLVLHRRDAKTQPVDISRALAAGMPRAELVVLPGEAPSPFSGDVQAGVDAILRFLGLADEAALDVTPRGTGAPPGERALTPREAEVLRLIAHGRANKEIAVLLGLSVHTVERHLTNLYPKIGCRSRTEAAAFALTHGLA